MERTSWLIQIFLLSRFWLIASWGMRVYNFLKSINQSKQSIGHSWVMGMTMIDQSYVNVYHWCQCTYTLDGENNKIWIYRLCVNQLILFCCPIQNACQALIEVSGCYYLILDYFLRGLKLRRYRHQFLFGIYLSRRLSDVEDWWLVDWIYVALWSFVKVLRLLCYMLRFL